MRAAKETVSDSVWFIMPRLLSHDWLNKTPFSVCAGYYGNQKHWTSMKPIRNCDPLYSETCLLCGDFLISLDSWVSFGKEISPFAPTTTDGHRCTQVVCVCKLAFAEGANKGKSLVWDVNLGSRRSFPDSNTNILFGLGPCHIKNFFWKAHAFGAFCFQAQKVPIAWFFSCISGFNCPSWETLAVSQSKSSCLNARQ